MNNISAIILTYNEEKNIQKCIESIYEIVDEIFIIDSFSSDKTVEIASKYDKVTVLFNKWVNYSTQFLYGLTHAPIKSTWILRFDADERLTPESAKEIKDLCDKNKDTDINGIIIRFKVTFLGKELRHGGIYPLKVLRVFKKAYGTIEATNMDEHIYLTQGKSIECKHDSLHEDYKDIYTWIDKHNKYSNREVLDYESSLQSKHISTNLDKKASKRRKLKYRLYYKLPPGLRAKLYYIYRYYFKFGFLDGKEGKYFAFLQAYWYRYLVDIKIYEYRKNGGNNHEA